jgi:hypothetical protein
MPAQNARTPVYTVEDAVDDAYAVLEGRFGNVDQTAAVQLAIFLYGVKPRDDFQLRRSQEKTPYGGGLTT